MKSKLLKTIFGLSLFALTVNVNATIGSEINSVVEGNNKADATVTVGEVAAPVYEVNVIWGDLTFDWTYDSETNGFRWTPADVCLPIFIDNEDEFNNFDDHYTDADCTEKTTEYTEGTDYYVIEEREMAEIYIGDYSKNGQIVPSIKWNAATEYADVLGKFKYKNKSCLAIETESAFDLLKGETQLFTDLSCSTEASTMPTFEANKYYVLAYRDSELISEELPDTARYGSAGSCYFDKEGNQFCLPFGKLFEYRLYFSLEGGTTPTSGDEIGTITISIRAK